MIGEQYIVGFALIYSAPELSPTFDQRCGTVADF